ncbi:MAG: S41 family peptidase [Planctomycetota bacterium]
MLHVLHEVDRTYEADWRRLSQRRAMIGFYAPERLYEMVSDDLVAEGEEALPPFNQSGPTWRERVRGLESDMVAQALKRASQRHIEEVPIRDMLAGGFDALRVMATTPELADALPQLRDETDVRDFLERLDANSKAIAGIEGELRFFHVDRAMRVLERINEESVNLPIEALLHEFGNGATARLDEYSSFYWPETIERANRTTQGNFRGVGIQITQNEQLELEVITPVAGTPAFRAGVRPGDIIAEIDGQPALGLDTNSAVERITGPAGTRVTLGIKREGEDGLIDFTLERAIITLYAARGWERMGESETDWDWFVDKEAGIGYVRLSQFLNGATDQTRDAIRDMKREGLNGLILDLRYNSGGLLNEAVDLTNLFVNSGVVVTQEDADGMVQDIQRAKRGRALLEDVPIVVLVNGGSASASEIVAGALQDYGKAVLVGTRTYGKGSVQRIFPLDRAGRAAFKLTTQYYKLPSGRLIHRTPGSSDWGIAPDVEVRMMPNEIADALQVRRDADVITRDERGNTIAEATDPAPLVTDGLDPQLQTAVLLLRTKVKGDQLAQRDTRP